AHCFSTCGSERRSLLPVEHNVLLPTIRRRIAWPFFGGLGLDVEHLLARGGVGWKLDDKCARTLHVWVYLQVYSGDRDRSCRVQFVDEFERFYSLHIIIFSAQDSSLVVLIDLLEPGARFHFVGV